MLDRTIRVEGPVRRIAVFRALFLGDLVCALPAFHALAEAFPEAEITLIGLPWVSELVGRIPYIHRFERFSGYDGIIEMADVPDRTQTFVACARKRRYDITLQMHGRCAISNGFAAGLGSRLVAGYCNGPDERLEVSLQYHWGEHEVLRWLRLGERETTEAVRGMMRCPALDLAGKTSLETFVALIARLGLLVTNDTGASHVASLTRTRSVILFGPSRPEEWAPLNRKRHRVIDAVKPGEPNTDPITALPQLPVEPVVEACDEQLCPARGEGSTNVAGKNGAPPGWQRYVEAAWSG